MCVGSALVLAGLSLWMIVPALDVAIDRMLHLPHGSMAIGPIATFTDLGGAAVMIPLALAGAVLLLIRRRPAAALWLFLTIASGRLIVEALKYLCDRARPPVSDQFVTVSTAAFPSSHSAGTILTLTALLIAFGIGGRAAWALAGLFALAIGVSRIMLGVHWPSDVLGGWGFGLLWAAMAASRLPARDRAAR